ncbi:MAG TPA: autotransporter domain-containing protein [Reyranella sp.]|nr:autotransporter domain-containing protein [Reyranella sp.]
MDTLRKTGRIAGPIGLAVLALASGPAHAQWNYYGNGQSFYVPFTNPNVQSVSEPRYVSLSLNYNGGTKATNFLVDTGSLGIVAGSSAYTYNPAAGDMLLGQGGITYTTSGTSPAGTIYLTNVTINGANGQTATARVPILSATDASSAQMGIGFDRGGLQLNSGAPLPNLNPLLGLTAINGQAVGNMAPGYIVGFNGFNLNGQSYTPGIMLGLNQQNTSGFSFVQLTPQGGLPVGCSTPGMGCPLNWNSQTGSVTLGGTSAGNMPLLPDSGIGYMLVQVPNGSFTTGTGTCAAAGATASNCLPPGTVVQIFLPGQTQAAASYTFTVGGTGNPATPFGVAVDQGSRVTSPFTNPGRSFFNTFNYLYDPINGFVGYSLSGIPGTTGVLIPLLALQGNLVTQNGFAANVMTYLMSNLNLTQAGSGTWNGSIFGPGGLALQSGAVTLAGANTYTGGTTVNGGTLTIGSGGSIIGNLTVNSGAAFVNNGTVNTPGVWQANQGTFTNNGAFLGNLATVGSATNTGTMTGSVINGGSFVNSGAVNGDFLNLNVATATNTGTLSGSVANSGMFVNNGAVNGNFQNAGVLSGNGTIGGNFFNMGVMAPGNSIGTINVAGNFVNAASGTYLTEVVGQGQSDRITVGGAAALQGGTVVVSVLPGLAFAPSTTYTLVSAAGGLSGTFAAVNELYPFLQSNLSYDANNAYLTLQVGGFAAQALNSTQYAVGSVLDASAPNASGDYATVLGTLATATAQQGQAFMTAISGQNYSGLSSSMVQGAQLFMNNFATQAGGATGGRVALAEACDVACDTTSPALWGAWGGALGGLGTVGAGLSTGAVTYNLGGFAAGLDRMMTPNLRAGVTVGYLNGTQWVGGFTGQGFSNTVQAGLYGNYSQGNAYLDGLASYAYSANQMSRGIFIPNLPNRTAQGQTGSNQVFGQLEGGYRFDLGGPVDAFVTPFARLQGYTGTQNAFSENGAQSLNLNVAAQTTNSLRSVLGAQLGGGVDMGWREKLVAQFRLGWSHEYADPARPVSAALAGAPTIPFTTYGASLQRDGVVVGVSANTAVAAATSLYLRYEGNISGQDTNHALTAGVRMAW